MNILWITNILFPEAERILTGDGELKSSGGWMVGAANALSQSTDVSLSIATVSPLVRELTILEGNKLSYYVLPYGKGNLKKNTDYIPYWRQIHSKLKPDIVHIHGTEFSHGYAYIQACGIDNVVVSIQGMKSAIHYYYHYGMSDMDIFRSITLKDIIRGTIWQQKNSFKKSGEIEKLVLRTVKHVIGRTTWDRSRVWAINPKIKYHFCNETLRTEFYDGSLWEYENCTKHSIFLSQASYPLKGLHQVLKAMPLILRDYPATTIRIAGNDITNRETFMNRLKYSGYGRYINRLVSKYKLQDKVTFLGCLNAEQIKEEYQKANVFICPSSIENSPNSLGEAQILGVPCIASYVGGVPDMMKGDEDNLYRFEEYEMLAEKVCYIFSRNTFDRKMRNSALERHNPTTNCNKLLEIYKLILES